MEKNRSGQRILRWRWQKLLMTMKLFVVYMCFFSLGLSARTMAQQERVRLNMKEVSFQALFNEIQRQTKLSFLFNHELVDQLGKISVEADDETVEEVLNSLFDRTGLTYVVKGNMIVVKEKRLVVQEQKTATVLVRGRVTDEGGTPLPGVTVLIKGTTLGTSTDIEGIYKFKVPKEKYTLVFTMVGMETREITLSTGKEDVEVNVVLQTAVNELGDVVVTGIFKKARESYTGSVSTITAEDLRVNRGQNLLQTLKNADASLNFAVNNMAGSNPNTLPKINIRGNSSLPMDVESYNKSLTMNRTELKELNESTSQSVNTPLIIMDGFEISLEKLMDYNDEEISSINILKDAAATAIYGSRGSNGVIVIVSKQPEPGRLRISAEVGMDLEVPDLTSYDLLNAAEKLELERSVGLYEANYPNNDLQFREVYNERLRRVLSGATTDWIDKPIRTGVGSHYNLRLEGGSEQFRWSATTNYKDTQGAMKNSSHRTFNGSVTLMYTLKNLTFKNYTSYGMSRNRESNYGLFSDYVAQQPYNLPYDENGNVLNRLEGFYPTRSVGTANPLYDATLNTIDKSGYEELTNNFSIEWKIIEGLTLRGQFGIASKNSHSDYFLPAEHSYFTTGTRAEIYATDEGFFRRGRYQYGTGNSVNTTGNITLSYNKLFRDKHSLYVGLDYSVAAMKSTGLNFILEGFSNEDLNFIGNANAYEKDGMPSGNKSQSRRLGFTANVNYTYDNRYYVDASARVDGSSSFGSDKKYAPFWSVGLGWNLHREQFLESNEVLNMLRLKASYGQTGSQQGSGSGASTVYAYQTGNKYMNWTGAVLSEWGNPKLTWQTTDELNIGTEIGLWQGRIKAEFDFYTKTTNNLLSSMDLPLSMGLSSYMANVGEVKNRGWEASLSAYIIRDPERELNWMVSGQLVYDKNWISKLSDAVKTQNEAYLEQDVDVSNLFYEGNPQNAIYAVRSQGIDPSTGEEIFLDRDGNITEEWKAGNKVYMGSSEPLYRGNLNTMVMWKGLTFNVSFGYYWGGKTYNQTLVDRVEVTRNDLMNSNVDRRVYTERWQQPGDATFFKGIGDEETRATSRFVMDDNVLELQSASLQWRWDNDWIRRQFRLSSVTFGVNMSNLFHWSSVRLERGTSYPFARNIQGSIKILF